MTETTTAYDPIMRKRFEFIDALRGLAAFSVLIYHVVGIHQDIVAVPKWARAIVLNGGMGVTLFFLVSAFCLCLTMRKHEREVGRTWKFYLRRIFRIVPLFYVLLAVTLLRDRAVHGSHSLADVLSSAFFFFNFVPGKQEGIVWASWTLGVEMIFYLLFPFICLFANNFRKSLVFLGVALAVSACFSAVVRGLPITVTHGDIFVHNSFFSQLPVFALGMVAFYAYEEFIYGKNRSAWWAYFLVGLAVMVYFALWIKNPRSFASGIVLPGIVCAVFFLGLAIVPLRILVNQPSRFIGKISYSFYLIHPVIVYHLKPVYRAIYQLNIPASLQYLVCLVLALVPLTMLAYLAYRFVEQPGIRLGDSLINRFSSGTPTALVFRLPR